MNEEDIGAMFVRVRKLTEENKVALLYRLWGYLETNTPKFIEGLELFIPQLEKEQLKEGSDV